MGKKARAALFGGSLVMGVASYGAYRYAQHRRVDRTGEAELTVEPVAHTDITPGSTVNVAVNQTDGAVAPEETDDTPPTAATVLEATDGAVATVTDLDPESGPGPRTGRHRRRESLRFTEHGLGIVPIPSPADEGQTETKEN